MVSEQVNVAIEMLTKRIGIGPPLPRLPHPSPVISYAGKVCGGFGQGLLLGGRPCPANRPLRYLQGGNKGHGLSLKQIVPQFVSDSFASLGMTKGTGARNDKGTGARNDKGTGARNDKGYRCSE